MSIGPEGIGEAVTGGMIARAVEPEAGEAGGEAHSGSCLNCGAALVGDYCHACGQAAHVHRSIHAWWHDFLHSVLHLEGKMWRTLPLLVLHPGQLTRRYIEGERARFVSPLALFLFSVFVMFAVVSFSGAAVLDPGDTGAAAQAIEEEVRGWDRRIQAIEAERAAAAAARQDMRAVDARLAAARRERDAVRAVNDLRRSDSSGELEFKSGWADLDEGVKKATQNPSLFFYKVQTNAYKLSWALIPISVPFLWLLFLHRRRYRQEYKAYDHMVFVTYSISFMSLGAIFLVMLDRIGLEALIGPLAVFVPPVHIYRQLRGAYRLGRASAAWRTFALIIVSALSMTLFLLLLLTLGVFS